MMSDHDGQRADHAVRGNSRAMAFSVIATGGVALILLLILAAGMSPVLAIPVVLVLAAVAVATWLLLGSVRNRRVVTGPGPSGVPSTRDASYDPVQRP
jgi:Flp pilus assembly protein TadB